MKRTEYPRPQLVRQEWLNLNGEWLFAYDDEKKGVEEHWYREKGHYDKKINVPFVYQSKESGIEERVPHDVVWYQREFEIVNKPNARTILHFGAVDYEADIYINGQHACHHIGGHTSFEIDITDNLNETGLQQVSVRAFDPHYDESIPRGKQFWEDESAAIWYTNSTGIWQTVWIEQVNTYYLTELKLTPHFDEGKIEIETVLSRFCQDAQLEYVITFRGEKIASGNLDFITNKLIFEVELYQEHIFRTNYHNDGWSWTPENPNLFDLDLRVRKNKEIVDEVQSYFGMRKVHTDNGMVYLNNKPYYQKLVLDQGYWPTGLLTAPTDEDFKVDIELSKKMGFNGCRKHQKMEDPRFLYWADQLGFIVWGECAAPPIYNRDSVERLMIEWTDILKRDYNHPCIITWVPINESWGVPNISFDRQQQHFSQAIYNYVRSLDMTRLVISNDGWAATDTDIVAIHNYQHGQEDEVKKYNYFKDSIGTREKLLCNISTPWPIFADGFSYRNQPILLTEFGGIGFDVSGQPGWGYTSVKDKEEFIADYQRIMDAVYASTGLWGYCYTQITDVEQEINGLLTYNRQPKCDLEKIKEINDGFHVFSVE
ncbi:glycoside hydrolase family 2 protein [Enterococcus sp. LJL98]